MNIAPLLQLWRFYTVGVYHELWVVEGMTEKLQGWKKKEGQRLQVCHVVNGVLGQIPLIQGSRELGVERKTRQIYFIPCQAFGLSCCINLVRRDYWDAGNGTEH